MTIFSILIKQIYRKQIYLKKKVHNTRAKLSRLKKQLNLKKKKNNNFNRIKKNQQFKNK